VTARRASPGAQAGRTAAGARSTRPPASPDASRNRILDAALELVARYGYEGMSLKLLADHVGLHKSTLFHHFPGKGELVDEVLMGAMAEIVALAEPHLVADPPELGQLVELGRVLETHFAEHRSTALFAMRVLLGPVDDFHQLDFEDDRDPSTRLFTLLGGWLDRARRAGVIRPVSVREAIVNLMALLLFRPALVDAVGGELPFGDPASPTGRRRRQRELAETLRRAFAP